EDHLHLRAHGAHTAAAVIGDVRAVEDDLTSGGLQKLENGAAGGGLAAAALAHDAQGLSLLNGEVHAVHSVELAPGGVKIFCQILDFQNDLSLSHFGSSSAGSSPCRRRGRPQSGCRPWDGDRERTRSRPRWRRGTGERRRSPRADAWDPASCRGWAPAPPPGPSGWAGSRTGPRCRGGPWR